MTSRLQSFDFQSSPYERPTQTWICGRAANGAPCPHGPSKRGRCEMVTACQPRRNGDDWDCGRPELAGGCCSEGPRIDGTCPHRVPPCVPQRSMRSRRGRVALAAGILSLCALLFIFSGTIGHQILQPGPISADHAEMGDCSLCHVAFAGGPANWLHAAFTTADPAADSKKCLACHDKGEHALNAHNLSTAALTDITQDLSQREPPGPTPIAFSVVRAVFPVPEQTNGDLACATCHKEHEGEGANLMQVANARCQSCHVAAFAGFADGHPKFHDYPYDRRTRLVFDHASHNRKHFPEEGKEKSPDTCVECHSLDTTGRHMVVSDFDQMCGDCHTKDIAGESVAGPKGITVIAVPGLDIETLTERGIDIGTWPDTAVADDLTPITKLLLAGDRELAPYLFRIAAMDLQDLSQASKPELTAVARVAWGFKELLFDLTVSGPGDAQKRLEASLRQSLDRDTLGRLFGHIPRDVLKAATQTWFPTLNREVLGYRAKRSATIGPDGGKRADAERLWRGGADQRAGLAAPDAESSGFWRAFERIVGPIVEPILAFADSILIGQAGGDSLSDDDLLSVDDDFIHPEDELLLVDESGTPLPGVEPSTGAAATATAKDEPAPAPEETETAAEDNAPEETETAAEDEAPEAPAEETASAEPEAEADETAAAESKTAESKAADAETPAEASQQATERPPAEPESAPAATEVETARPAEPATPTVTAEDHRVAADAEDSVHELDTSEQKDIEVPGLDPEAWATAGGWYRQDEALFYRPVGHRDSFVKAWLDISAASFGTPSEIYGDAVFAVLTDKDTPGKCIKCHSVDVERGLQRTINWQPFAPVVGESKFTMFMHDAHFSAVDDKGCVTCHQLNVEEGYLDSYKSTAADSFVPNFAPMQQDTCTACHIESAAGETCTLCHRYHIGQMASTPTETRVAALSVAPTATAISAEDQGDGAELSIPAAIADLLADPEADDSVALFVPPTPEPTEDGRTPQAAVLPEFKVAPLADRALARDDPKPGTEQLAAVPTQPALQPPSKPEPPALAPPLTQPATATPSKAETLGGAFSLRLSSHRTEAEAQSTAEKLAGSFGDLLGGKEFSINRSESGDRGTFYRLHIGPYGDRDTATKDCKLLRSKRTDCRVVQE